MGYGHRPCLGVEHQTEDLETRGLGGKFLFLDSCGVHSSDHSPALGPVDVGTIGTSIGCYVDVVVGPRIVVETVGVGGVGGGLIRKGPLGDYAERSDEQLGLHVDDVYIDDKALK